MSSIYGFLLNNDRAKALSDITLEHLYTWNKAYGEHKDRLLCDGYGLGACVDRLNDNLPINKIVIEDDDKYAVIDSVLYNRDEIFDKLGKEYTDTDSDEELLFEYIQKNGYKALSKVNGDFAGAILDKKDNTLTLFRDHMGIRPLFYYCNDSFVVFSTDIRGIIAVSEVDCSISEDWIYKTAKGAINSDLVSTEYQNIFCVKPGSFLTISFSVKGIKKDENIYWSVGRKKIRLSSDAAYQKRLRELIEDSVKRRLDAVSGMVGAELSGGLDSGVISILINRFGRECKYYSWSQSPELLGYVKDDERLVIKDICEQENIKCHFGELKMKEGSSIYDITKDTGIRIKIDELPHLRYVLPSYINSLKIIQTAEDLSRLGAKVVFTGHGGDEGVSHRPNPYEMFHYHEFYHYFRYMFSTTNGFDKRITRTIKKCKENLIEDRKAFEKPFYSSIKAEEALKGSFANSYKGNVQNLLFAYDPIAYIRDGGSRSRLDNVALLSTYSKVRYIVPYLDYRVIDFAVSIPRYQYLRGRKNRYVFREAFKDIIPASLYRLRLKNDMSVQGAEKDPDWFEEFKRQKNQVVNTLDRKMWDKYLDFDVLEAWKDKGEPTGEEIYKDNFFLITLLSFAAAQNVIDKTRAVK
ncbi:asparagine synthase-related protein [Butyrivibrio proteoclasticus]|uniref:asparagine synthase-related protein n=1 Tax=Butyrivibrio proteoclasticus TaxID=43305 RepID=UPI000479F185|nr:asparagine synthase-related protein [Butyrivibrio proteoclasticus]